jgi:hypothetical protein
VRAIAEPLTCNVFLLDHSQFSEVISRVAWVVADALPTIAKHFKSKENQ